MEDFDSSAVDTENGDTINESEEAVSLDNETPDVVVSREDDLSEEAVADKDDEVVAITTTESKAEQESTAINEQEARDFIEKESPYSKEVNEYISSPEELQLYKEAGLKEQEVDGRICLVKENIDLDYYDEESEKTNRELIAEGRSPYDAKTGERIELHHIGQKFEGPLAELNAVSEHDLHSKALHKSEDESWRRDPQKVSEYQKQRRAHWKSRY